MREHLFTSESVTEGHPDKLADQISDGVLDAILAEDHNARVACETLVTTGQVVVAGEVSTTARVDIPEIVRAHHRAGGLHLERGRASTRPPAPFSSPSTVRAPTSPKGVDTAHETRVGDPSDPYDLQGAGDQGLMFGYATDETPQLMPVPITLAHRISERLAAVRHSGQLAYLRPDGKTQVTVRYQNGQPVGVDTVVLSTQHNPGRRPGRAGAGHDQRGHPARRWRSTATGTAASATSSTPPASSWSGDRWATPA